MSRDGIAIFASTELLSKALPQVVVLLSLFFISMMLNGWPTDLGWLILATIPPDRSQHNRGAGSIAKLTRNATVESASSMGAGNSAAVPLAAKNAMQKHPMNSY